MGESAHFIAAATSLFEHETELRGLAPSRPTAFVATSRGGPARALLRFALHVPESTVRKDSSRGTLEAMLLLILRLRLLAVGPLNS